MLPTAVKVTEVSAQIGPGGSAVMVTTGIADVATIMTTAFETTGVAETQAALDVIRQIIESLFNKEELE